MRQGGGLGPKILCSKNGPIFPIANFVFPHNGHFGLERGGGGHRDALEGGGGGAQRRPIDRRLEEVAKAGGGGYRRLRMPFKLAFGVRGQVAGHRLGRSF